MHHGKHKHWKSNEKTHFLTIYQFNQAIYCEEKIIIIMKLETPYPFAFPWFTKFIIKMNNALNSSVEFAFSDLK